VRAASIVVVGLNHRTAPVGLLERLAIGGDALPKALQGLSSYEHVLEGAIVSTCNRVEVCAVVSRFHGGAQDLRNFLGEFCHVAPEELTDHLYTYHDEGAVRHILRVAAGLDSMVVGETEVLGQVRRAFAVASQEGSARRVLGHVFRRALALGKRARAETGIARTPVSFSSAAVELARRARPDGSLASARVLIIGAGKMGGLSLRAATGLGAREVVVTSRTEVHARSVAEPAGVRVRPLEELGDAVSSADVVLSSTASTEVVVDRATIEAAVAGRTGASPLVIVDVAVPRDVDPSIAEVPGVVLRDIDDLRAVVEANLGSRVAEISKVEAMIADELDRFVTWERADELAPTIAALVERADDIRRAERRRADTALRDLTPEQQQAVDHLTRRIVAKMLHTPIRRAKELAGDKQGHLYLQAVRELYELDDERAP
jgi:glutamyl-tRNA reductase